MGNLYSKQFYEESLGVDYSDREYWSSFFGRIAKKIVEEFNPKTVLDAGCASGYLVEALRDLGVAAYGIDISEYAINCAREDIKQYLNVQSLTEDLPQSFPKFYDLVITIEVLEHLYAEDGKMAIKRICSYSDTIIFTSTPYDLENKTHVNVQQREYWAELFAKKSFYRDLVQRVDFICEWAMLFRKRSDISRVIFEYELSDRVDAIKEKNKSKNIEKKTEKLKCYYKLEGQDSYSEEFSIEQFYTIDDDCLVIQFCENKPVVALRIDPMECNCIIKHFHVYDLQNVREELAIKFMNGIISRNSIVFEDNDPMVEIEVPQNNGVLQLEIAFEIEHVDDSVITDTYRMLSWEKHLIDKLKEETIANKKVLETNEMELKKQEEEMGIITEELMKKLEGYQETEQKIRENYETQIQNLNEQYEELRIEKNAVQQELMGYLKEKESLAIKLEELVKQKSNLEEMFKEEQQNYFRERENLRGKLDVSYEQKREQLEKLQDEKRELCLENQVLKLNLNATERLQKELEEKFALLEQKSMVTEEKFENKKEELEKELKKFTEVLETKKEEIEILDAKYAKVKAELEKVQEQLKDSVNDYEVVSSQRKELATQKKDLEETVKSLSSECTDTKERLGEVQEKLKDSIACYQDAINQREELRGQLNYYTTHYYAAINQREELIAQNNILQKEKNEFEVSYQNAMTNYKNAMESYQIVISSTCWKITSPLRKFMDFIRGNKTVENAVALVKQTSEELEEQKKVKFSKNIKFSILVPLYNTPLNFLHEMIQSVTEQTYANWELCLADGSDNEHRNVKSEVLNLAKKDKRIKYKKLKENKGISENTNECIEMATGDYIVLFDHDDILHPSALFEVMKAICEQDADFIYTDENTFSERIEDAYCPHYKPDYSPDTLRSYNYICHLTVFKKDLLKKTGGGFRKEFDGSQDYDMVLRLTEVAEHIVHIPKILYYWRAHKNSVALNISAKPYTLTAAKRALTEHLERVGLKGEVCDARIPSTYQIQYEIQGKPLISIIIPNKDHIEDLDKCIQSIEKKSTYKNVEIIIVENNSTETETKEYYKKIQRKYKNIRVVTWREGFNYSKINNFGFQYAKGEYIVLLNNDIEILTPDWLEQMLMYTQRSEVGATGMMLYYPDDTIQHAGVILGIGGIAGHSHKYFKRGEYGYASRLCIVQNLSAVTAASMMIRADVFKQIGGLDEEFAVAFNDVDLCMRIREAGYLIVWTPFAEAYHYESKSRGFEDTPEKQIRFKGEIERFMDKWGKFLEKGDPYYNPNLTLEREDFTLR